MRHVDLFEYTRGAIAEYYPEVRLPGVQLLTNNLL